MAALLGFVVGLALGAYIFIDTRARNFLPLPKCTKCFSKQDLGGLLVSIGVQKTPALLPDVVAETDLVIAMKSPQPLATIDFLILPKKDILDIGDLQVGEEAYIAESFEVMGELVRRYGLHEYKVITNGPGFQQVRYLHFHLLAQ